MRRFRLPWRRWIARTSDPLYGDRTTARLGPRLSLVRVREHRGRFVSLVIADRLCIGLGWLSGPSEIDARIGTLSRYPLAHGLALTIGPLFAGAVLTPTA